MRQCGGYMSEILSRSWFLIVLLIRIIVINRLDQGRKFRPTKLIGEVAILVLYQDLIGFWINNVDQDGVDIALTGCQRDLSLAESIPVFTFDVLLVKDALNIVVQIPFQPEFFPLAKASLHRCFSLSFNISDYLILLWPWRIHLWIQFAVALPVVAIVLSAKLSDHQGELLAAASLTNKRS